MSSQFRVVYTVPSNAQTVKDKLRLIVGTSPYSRAAIERIGSYTDAISCGAYSGKLQVATSAVAATAVIGPLNGADSDDTVTIGITTLSASASTQDGTHWKIGATDVATAANLATCINANTHTSKYVSAVADSSANVNLTMLIPGEVGNTIVLASSDGVEVPVSGAHFTGGSEDVTVVLENGQS